MIDYLWPFKEPFKNKRHSGLCGQAPSDYPEFTEFLVKEGIESVSLSPDAVMKVTLNLLDVENKMSLLSQALQIANTHEELEQFQLLREMAVAQRLWWLGCRLA